MKDIEKYINETIENINLIKSDEIPNIELYMDQVTTFLTSNMGNNSENNEPAFTKTMINNYAKSKLLPAPEKKKYSKDHLLLLIIIYYLKNVMSINNIDKLLSPVTDKYFHCTEGLSMTDVYDEIREALEGIKETTLNDITEKFKSAGASFKNAPADEKDYLQLYSFISLLSFDVYMKKQLINTLIETLDEPSKE